MPFDGLFTSSVSLRAEAIYLHHHLRGRQQDSSTLLTIANPFAPAAFVVSCEATNRP